MSALDTERERHDDICPLCDQGIEDDGRHILEDEIRVWCRIDGGWFDVAVLDWP